MRRPRHRRRAPPRQPAAPRRQLLPPPAALAAAAVFAALLGRPAAAQATATETATLTGSDTVTLPAATDTATVPSATRSATRTATATLTLPEGTATVTLPSRTEATLTVPSASSTVTLASPTATTTSTVTLPATSSTETYTRSASFTLPSATGSGSASLPTMSATGTTTVTLPSSSASFTTTSTLTLPAHDNYTMLMGPASFYDGQEVRIQLRAVLEGGGAHPDPARGVAAFNASAAGSLSVRVYAWRHAIAGDCDKYVAEAAPLAELAQLGLSEVERVEGNTFVAAAHATFTAPHSSKQFVLCFMHAASPHAVNSPVINRWLLFATADGSASQYVFQARPSRVWYYLPEATDGQYAIVQLLSQEPWNFTYPATTCGASPYSSDQAVTCGLGDNLKVVPAGEPCTIEHQGFDRPFLGSHLVGSAGEWDSSALDGLRIGATAGGVGRFGTQYANPLVDTWTSWGTYFPANDRRWSRSTSWSSPEQPYLDGYAHHAYVYLRLPQRVGTLFDVCFSSREQRAEWRLGLNGSVESVPMWRKLHRCTAQAACGSDPAAPGWGLSFELLREPVGWSMYDLTPNTWGTIVFDDAGGSLSSEPSGSTILVNAPVAAEILPGATGAAAGYDNNANYWLPQGGDYFRIVKATRLGELAEWQGGLFLGSFANVGCWDRSLDDPQAALTTAPQQGGWIGDGAEYPVGSRDLTGDPTLQNPLSDAHGLRQTYATLWVPTRHTAWHVCYRRSCGSAAAGACTRSTGLRVLPWHDSATNARGHSAVPVKFLHLDNSYTPRVGSGVGAVPLIPYEYGAEDGFPYPPALAWYMNDTRSMTWGPLVVEKTNYSEAVPLDSRPWTGVRRWNEGGCAAGGAEWDARGCNAAPDCDQLQCTQGSALRLVRSDRPCDWPGFTGSLSQGAGVTDGGAVECNSLDAGSDRAYCSGRMADSAAAATVAFYITVPEVVAPPAGYRVCFRLQGWNWREVWPAREEAAAWGGSFQPSGARQRGDWRLPNTGTTQDTSPDNGGVDNWYQASPDARLTMSVAAVEDRATMEALFLVSDTRLELSAAPRRSCPGGCEDSGDVFRLVRADRSCDVYPTAIDGGGWDPALADSHLSAICLTAGAGSPVLSGLYLDATAGQAPCAGQLSVRALCKGLICSKGLSESPTNMTSGLGDTVLLAEMLKSTPELYDDIVPYESVLWNHGMTAAAVELPQHTGAPAADSYRLCYKQMATSNWVIFNDTWVLQPAPGYVGLAGALHEGRVQGFTDLADGVSLLAGEFQLFAVVFPDEVAAALDTAVRPSGLAAVYAKLVKDTGDGNHCLNPAGGTEGQHFASATQVFIVGRTKAEVQFYLTVPHEPGQYDLCVQVRRSAEDSMSWWRGARAGGRRQRITVADNGLRYYFTHGSQPVNQGQSLVSLVRCTPPPPPSGPAPPEALGAVQPCDYGANTEVFDTSPGRDAAKIVAVSQPCSDGAAGGRSYWGSSGHAGRRVFGAAAGGVADLGPADGLSDVAEFTVVPPATASDAPANYKVCVYATFAQRGLSRRAWVEVPQAANFPGQLTVTDVYTGRRAFQTAAAYASHWRLGPELRPGNVSLSGGITDLVGNNSVAIAGASTRVVTWPTGVDLTPTALAFHVHSYSGLSTADRARFGNSNIFKLVAVRSPRARAPLPGEDAQWGRVGEWAEVPGASCASPGVVSANTIDACSAPDAPGGGHAACPSIQTVETVGDALLVPVLFQVPLTPGQYAVCYKLNATDLGARPWLLLRSYDAVDGTNGDTAAGAGYFYSVPSFLEFEAAAPFIPAAGAEATTANLTAFDLRTVVNASGGQVESLSGWCSRVPEISGAGVPCLSQNGALLTGPNRAYWQDLVAVVNSTQVCPVPYEGSTGNGLTGADGVQPWHPLVRLANASAAVDSSSFTAFALPPPKPHPSGLYKICLFKTGEASHGPYSTQFVTKRGVVYQLYNRGSAESGGGSGYWRDPAKGAAAQLLVATDLDYNTTLRFVEFQAANGETQMLYGPGMVHSAAVADPVTGTVSRTPLLRSGSTVDFYVRAATASGEYTSRGSFSVRVYRCAPPADWGALACPVETAKAPGEQEQPFSLVNTAAACAAGDAGAYGWPPDGLTQFLDKGAARFVLQYRSACRGGEFGCGVRFVARPPGATADVLSLPQWVNIEHRHYPDAVRLGPPEGAAADVAPGVLPSAPRCEAGGTCGCAPPRCYLMECYHREPCGLVAQARFEGIPEYAPAGRVAVHYSAADYVELRYGQNPLLPPASLAAAVSGATSLAPTTWPSGGAVALQWARPELRQPDHGAAHVYLNVTWSGPSALAERQTWTRVVARITRPEPAALEPLDLRPLDLESPAVARLRREPAPRFRARRDGSELRPEEGSYIEALVPYELRYRITRPGGSPLPPSTGLRGWLVSGVFEEGGGAGNRVLRVEESADGPAAGNLLTLPAYTSHTLTSAAPDYDAAGWFLRFRVFSNAGCGRFTGGCGIRFALSKLGAALSPHMTVRAAVRVPGSTLLVTTHAVGGQAAAASAPAAEGLLVRAVPGTPCEPDCGFLADEWHWGDVFALISSPGPTDGARGRDGVMLLPDGARCAYPAPDGRTCMVSQYTPRAVSVGGATVWAAEWVMKPSMPCHDCEFSFHSATGAAPYTYGPTRYGMAKLSFVQGTLALACNGEAAAATDVAWELGSPVSRNFSVTLTAAPAADLAGDAQWPRWWTWLDTTADVTGPGALLLRSRSGAALLRAQLGRGRSASVVHSGLYFAEGPDGPPTAPEARKLTFRAAGPVYDPAVPGAVPRSTQAHSCTVDVTVRPEDPGGGAAPLVRRWVVLTGADGAGSLCPAAGGAEAGCGLWWASVGAMRAGVTVRVRFAQRAEGGGAEQDDRSARNVTVVPATKPGDALAGQTGNLVFARDPATGRDVARLRPAQPIPSFYNPPGAPWTNSVDGALLTFSFGQLAVRFERSPVALARASLAVIYDDADSTVVGAGWPVRDARMRVCGSTWGEGEEVVETTAVPAAAAVGALLRLWVRPEVTTRQALFWEWEPSATPSPGLAPDPDGAPVCSPTAGTLLQFTLATYYGLTAAVGAAAHRWLVYDSAVSYNLSLGTQTLVPADQPFLTTPTLARRGLPLVNSTFQERVSNPHPFSALRAAFSFYGLHRVAAEAATAAQVVAQDLSNPQDGIGAASSPVAYSFPLQKEEFAAWAVLDEVRYDPECPSKRLLAVADGGSGYRSYSPAHRVPGAGWDYTEGAAAQLPFPIQTVVQVPAPGRGAAGDRRAWTFAGDNARTPGRSLVSVEKHSWSGCNDGGALSTHALSPSAPSDGLRAVPGALSSFGPAAEVYAEGGVATAWVVLQAPCQECTLQLQLCYMRAASAAGCLQNPDEALESDRRPLFADRSKVSKPFSVRRPTPTRLQIYAQSAPAVRDGAIRVGQGFRVDIEAVQLFGRWALRTPGAVRGAVWADAEPRCAGPCAADALRARYGNGGFLQGAASEQELAASLSAESCRAVGRGSLAAAALWPRPSARLESVSPQGSALGFHFTRPCSACALRISYEGLGGVQSRRGSFVLRQYGAQGGGGWPEPGAELVYRVVTCATGWGWAGAGPLPSYRKGAPFSLTAWRVDGNGFPSWWGTQVATLRAESTDGGNGNGGDSLPTSPRAADLRGGAPAVDGSATVRFSSSRACYRCRMSFGGGGSRPATEVAVLADATQIIALPFPTGEGGGAGAEPIVAADVNATQPTALWAFEVYAADEFGERAYTAAGPTLQPYQPRYSAHSVQPGRLTVAAPAAGTLAGMPAVLLVSVTGAAGDALVTEVSDGRPTSLRVANGSVVYNGIPFGELGGESTPPGVAVVEATGTGSYIPLSFSMPGAAEVPTRSFGSREALVLSFTVPATHLALEAGGAVCPGLLEGGNCSVRAFAVGRRPGAASTVFQLASAHRGSAAAAARCGAAPASGAPAPPAAGAPAPADCSVRVEPEADFERGVAAFAVSALGSTLPGADCTCFVTVTAPGLLHSPQTAAVSFAARAGAERFEWAASGTLALPADADGIYSVPNRTVTLALRAVTAAGGDPSGAVAWPAGEPPSLEPSAMTPAGCFVASAAGAVSDQGRRVEFAGSFQGAAEGACSVAAEAVLGLPLPLAAALPVTLQRPAAVAVVQVAAESGAGRERGALTPRHNFSGLVARTAAGAAAAVAGRGAVLSVRVVDSAGATVLGDFHSVVTATVSGLRGGPQRLSATASAGVASFAIDSADSTRRGQGDPPEHTPASVDVAASSALVGGGLWEAPGLSGVGGLLFVRRAAHLWVEVVAGMGEPRPLLNRALEGRLQAGGAEGEALAALFSNASGGAHLVTGFPFDLVVSAVDHKGHAVRHPEDGGAAVGAVFRPAGIPCAAADRSQRSPWVEATCIAGGQCGEMGFGALPPCGANGWTVEGEALQWLQIDPGQGHALLPNVRYTGARDGPTPFSITPAYGWEWDPGYTFAGELNMQRMQRICILSPEPDGGCLPCAPGPDPGGVGVAELCELPAALAQPRRDEGLSLLVAVLDDGGRIVLGDSDTQIAVRGFCPDTLSFVGVGGDFAAPPKFEVRRGVAEVADLVFDTACGNMTLIFESLPGAGGDAEGQAGRLPRIATAPFSVLPAPGDTPAPPVNPVAPPPVTLSFKLKRFAPMGVTAARNAVTLFANGISEEDFNAAMTKLVTGAVAVAQSAELTHVCGVPAGVADQSVSPECQGGAVDAPGPDFGCVCSAFGPARGAAPQQGAAVELAAKAVVDVRINPNAGNTFNDNPEAVSGLAGQVLAAMQRDLASPGGVLRTRAAAAFRDADPADLGFSAQAKATPAPPEGANTPRPSLPPTAGPATAAPTRTPETGAPTGAPQPLATPEPERRTEPPTNRSVPIGSPAARCGGAAPAWAAGAAALAAELLLAA